MEDAHAKSQGWSAGEKGEMYVEKLQAYLDGLKTTGESLPVDGRGQPIITKISEDSGIPRNSFYTNKGVKRLLYLAMGRPGEDLKEGDKESHYRQEIEWRDRRIQQLEQRLSVVEAENEGLRQDLSRYKVIENEVIKAGRRVIL
jgi:hypothetical protein